MTLFHHNMLSRRAAFAPPTTPAPRRALLWIRAVQDEKEDGLRPHHAGRARGGRHGDGKIIVRVNFKAKLREEGKQGRKTLSTNSIRSARTGLRAEDMNEEGGYILIYRKPQAQGGTPLST